VGGEKVWSGVFEVVSEYSLLQQGIVGFILLIRLYL